MRSVLLDTGVFVALLDKSEAAHIRCVSFFKRYEGQLLTTEAVLTETIYLLGDSIRYQKSCIEFIIKGGAILVPQSLSSLERIVELMEKYNDIPMDFADATLVVLAEDTGINEILTLDLRGFNAYRINGKTRFEILPD